MSDQKCDTCGGFGWVWIVTSDVEMIVGVGSPIKKERERHKVDCPVCAATDLIYDRTVHDDPIDLRFCEACNDKRPSINGRCYWCGARQGPE